MIGPSGHSGDPASTADFRFSESSRDPGAPLRSPRCAGLGGTGRRSLLSAERGLLFAVGGNEIAARLAGAPTARLRTLAYAISATLAAFGGVIVAARVGRGDVSSGASLMLDSVAASLIGFAVLAARRPNVFGAVVGAIFVGVLLNGLTMLNVPYYTQDFVKGAVLVGALGLTYGLGRRPA